MIFFRKNKGQIVSPEVSLVGKVGIRSIFTLLTEGHNSAMIHLRMDIMHNVEKLKPKLLALVNNGEYQQILETIMVCFNVTIYLLFLVVTILQEIPGLQEFFSWQMLADLFMTGCFPEKVDLFIFNTQICVSCC